MSHSTERIPPKSVLAWCSQNNHDSPYWTENGWRAFPKDSLTSEPVPTGLPDLPEGVDCLNLFE